MYNATLALRLSFTIVLSASSSLMALPFLSCNSVCWRKNLWINWKSLWVCPCLQWLIYPLAAACVTYSWTLVLQSFAWCHSSFHLLFSPSPFWPTSPKPHPNHASCSSSAFLPCLTQFRLKTSPPAARTWPWETTHSKQRPSWHSSQPLFPSYFLLLSLPLSILHCLHHPNYLALKQWNSEMLTWCWRIEGSQCKTMCCSSCIPQCAMQRQQRILLLFRHLFMKMKYRFKCTQKQ